MAKKGKKTAKTKKAKAGKLSAKGRLLLIVGILLGVVFLPTSTLLFIGLLPTIASFLFSIRGKGPRTSTVFAMNVAGCVPFVIKLWSGGNDFDAAVEIVTNPRYMSVIYTAAAFGYMIDWVVTGIVSSYLYQRGVSRMKAIKNSQQNLVKNWGANVAGGLQSQYEDSDDKKKPQKDKADQ